VLTFWRGLELRRQTGLKVRALVLSKLPAEERKISSLPAGYLGHFLDFFMCKLIFCGFLKTDKYKYNLKKIKTIDDHLD
jgi:hypothetical protein